MREALYRAVRTALRLSLNGGAGNTLKFLVDDIIDDTANPPKEKDWVAELVPSGSVWVKFTPAANADDSVKNYGIKMKATVTLEGAQTEYNGVKIFTVNATNSFVINDTASLNSVKITAAKIAECLTFNEGSSVVLDTYEKNFAYDQAMKTYFITITITQAA